MNFINSLHCIVILPDIPYSTSEKKRRNHRGTSCDTRTNPIATYQVLLQRKRCQKLTEAYWKGTPIDCLSNYNEQLSALSKRNNQKYRSHDVDDSENITIWNVTLHRFFRWFQGVFNYAGTNLIWVVWWQKDHLKVRQEYCFINVKTTAKQAIECLGWGENGCEMYKT